MKAQFPLLAAKLTQASTPTTLRIADGRPVKAEPPKAQGRAFQLMAEEARAAPDVVIGMFLFCTSFIIFVLCLAVVLVFRYVFSELIARSGSI